MLIAPTGSGKGAIFNLLVAAWPNLLWLAILPLKSLEMEMAARVGARAEYINSDHKSADVLARIKSDEVGIVFLSAEMAVGRDFIRLFEDEAFRKRLGGIVFDEAHTLYEWAVKSSFRPQLMELSGIRHILGRPSLAMSATLPTAHRTALKNHFELRNLETVDLGVNRPNLCIRIAAMQHSPNSFLDLAAWLPELWSVGEGEARHPVVPTIIYLNDKSKIQQLFGVLKRWYERAGLGGKCTIYTSESSRSHKERIKELLQSGEIVCLVATDAMGMGADISRIRRVIQLGFGVDDSEAAILQRVGRAGRFSLETAEGILLLEPWILGRTMRDDQQRAKIDDELLYLIDCALAGIDCIRKQFNDLIGQPETLPFPIEEIFGVPTGSFAGFPCCGTCADLGTPEVPSEFLPDEPPKADPLLEAKAIEATVRQRLGSWREEMLKGDWVAVVREDPLGADVFLRMADIDDIVSNIAKVAHGLRREDAPAQFQLKNFVRSRRRDSVLSDVEAMVRAVLQEYETNAQQRQDDLQAQRDRERDERAERKRSAAQAKFLEKCEKKFRDEQEQFERGLVQNLNVRPPRMCEACRIWNAEHGSDEQVMAYGHTKANSLCPAKLAGEAARTPAAVPTELEQVASGSNVTLDT
ncbi:unnamed protein product [Tilletia controversa]|nr:hypothetical protein A4X03_0g6850 [Tilletia caries]CAD6906450.1 unnamed protein product [Tilletia controversa]CAD7064804.1 unnamed protein product [Tilletia caries]